MAARKDAVTPDAAASPHAAEHTRPHDDPVAIGRMEVACLACGREHHRLVDLQPDGLAHVARAHGRNVRLDDAAVAAEGDLDPPGGAGTALTDHMPAEHAVAVLGERDVVRPKEEGCIAIPEAGGVEGQGLAL